MKGEDNTKYFCACATERYRRNTIYIPSLLLDDGRSVKNHEEKVVTFLSRFKNRMWVSNEPVYVFDFEDVLQRIPEL